MKKAKQQEVDNKNKAGTAWSHSYLNQKPWHPLSYPNQRRKWIAEQTQAERDRKAQEVAREYAQEQEFFRQSALLSKKEQEKAAAMQALSFMYMRPPGYNAESARAAEIADEQKNERPYDVPVPPSNGVERPEERPKPRVLDIYGRPVPTEAEFPALKNAPRLETGTVARAKPFAVEIRNVKCARCGSFGHQSGDRECTMKDIIMPNEQARLKRDDPLTAMMAVTSEANKWELKQPLGAMSPPRGGFKPDDPNQQILAGDVDDEYGGFLGGGDEFANMIASSLKKDKKKKKEKKKRRRRSASPTDSTSTGDSDSDRHGRKKHRNSRDRRNVKDDRHSRHKIDPDDEQDDRHRECKDEEDVDVCRDRYRDRHHRDDENGRHHRHREGRSHKDLDEDKYYVENGDLEEDRHHRESRRHRELEDDKYYRESRDLEDDKHRRHKGLEDKHYKDLAEDKYQGNRERHKDEKGYRKSHREGKDDKHEHGRNHHRKRDGYSERGNRHEESEISSK